MNALGFDRSRVNRMNGNMALPSAVSADVRNNCFCRLLNLIPSFAGFGMRSPMLMVMIPVQMRMNRKIIANPVGSPSPFGSGSVVRLCMARMIVSIPRVMSSGWRYRSFDLMFIV